jgi:serine/threonine protein kinase
MGEVYRARDTRLARDVAVKVLPESVAADPEALARFEREAKAVAALSHPNILAIFDFGTHEGISYAVMELLEGETLRGKLDSGPISQKQAVDYAQQIVKGLSATHEKGVVHRDLKPENLFVTNDGHLKILDFGLAKRVEAIAPGEETSAPTASGHTQPGTVMGTVGYMSPEQVRGLPVDHRSDIFSFGAILYELLSGQRAFTKDLGSGLWICDFVAELGSVLNCCIIWARRCFEIVHGFRADPILTSLTSLHRQLRRQKGGPLSGPRRIDGA